MPTEYKPVPEEVLATMDAVIDRHARFADIRKHELRIEVLMAWADNGCPIKKHGAVAAWAGDPVNEADLHARHLWLATRAEFREAMKTDPEFYDAKVAGWWVWGQCCWIGSGWCAKVIGPRDAGRGINRKLPHVGDAGRGEALLSYFEALAARLASCPECGTLCQRYRGHGLADGQLFDLNPQFVPWSHLPDWVAQAIDRQGIGVGWGRSHVCPPTRVAMTPAAGSDWDLIGGAS